jgi:GAF domain-containing protein
MLIRKPIPNITPRGEDNRALANYTEFAFLAGKTPEMPPAIQLHQDKKYAELNRSSSIVERLAFLDAAARERYQFVHQVGVATQDSKSACLKTFAINIDSGDLTPQYQYSLGATESLYRVIPDGRSRVIDDRLLLACQDDYCLHLREQGFRSSYTIPTYNSNKLSGFVFFNSREPDVFQPDRIAYLESIAHQITLLVSSDITQTEPLQQQ